MVQHRAGRRVRRAALYLLGHVLNPLMLAVLSRQPYSRLAILEHPGRRSGRVYRTPVEARLAPDGGFVIPLTWGQRTDWFQNVQAAGGCVLRWHGAAHRLGRPEIVAGPGARMPFQAWERLILRLAGVQFVRLRPAE